MRSLQVISAVALLVAAVGPPGATQGVPGDGGCDGSPGSLAIAGVVDALFPPPDVCPAGGMRMTTAWSAPPT